MNFIKSIQEAIKDISKPEVDCLDETIDAVISHVENSNDISFYCNGNVCIVNKKTCISIYKHDNVNSRVEIDTTAGMIDVSYNQSNKLRSAIRKRFELEVNRSL